jgi:hypothetical protein
MYLLERMSFDPHVFLLPPCADRPSDFDFTYNPWGYKPINTVYPLANNLFHRILDPPNSAMVITYYYLGPPIDIFFGSRALNNSI